MKYLSVCSGIEAASVAWHPLGWKPLAFSEIEPFPRAVLAHHYPDTPCHGDFTVLRDQPWIVDADVLVGGTPCQAFSVAGLRNSLADARGNLSLEFVRLADAIDDLRRSAGRPEAVIVWENVPGVLSVKDNAFGCFLAGLAGESEPLEPPGGRWKNAGCVFGPARTIAWRVCDAQYWGVAQRRKRVFLIASARDGFDPAAVLLEFEGVRRDSPPRREAGQGTAHATAPCLTSSGRGVERTGDTRGQDPVVAVAMEDPVPPLMARSSRGGAQTLSPGHQTDGHMVAVPSTGDISHCLNAGGMGRQDYETETLITHSLRAEGFDASEDGTGRGTPLVPVPFDTTQITSPSNYSNPQPGDPCHPLAAGAHPPAIAVQASQSGVRFNETVGTLDANYGSRRHNGVMTNMAVRRLTPVECERLQGFPDNYTAIPWKKKPAEDCPDGPRYKALGNSMAVPVMAWIGKRIKEALA